METIRILQCVNSMNRAGLETMLMNYYWRMDRSVIQFDFLTHRPARGDYDDEIESLGGRLYYAPRLYPWNYPAYFRWMRDFFKAHPEYKIIHSHIDAMSFLPLLAAKRAGVPVRIAHSHNTAIDLDFKYPLKQLFRAGINAVCNFRYACGEEAGRFLFGRCAFSVLPNAIDAEKFRYDGALRRKKRAELGLSEEFVVGHVGRFTRQKNHKFLLEVFSELLKREPGAVLLLVGTGEKEAEIHRQIQRLGIGGQVRLLGNRGDVNELYQAMDAFLMPSLFEGIPVVGVEAQYAGLPVFFSDRVPREVKFTDCCRFLSLGSSAAAWAGELLSCQGEARAEVRDGAYDIREKAGELCGHYLALISNEISMRKEAHYDE